MQSTHLSTVATMGETVIAAVAAVTASTKILMNNFFCLFSGNAAAIVSMEPGADAWTLIVPVTK